MSKKISDLYAGKYCPANEPQRFSNQYSKNTQFLAAVEKIRAHMDENTFFLLYQLLSEVRNLAAECEKQAYSDGFHDAVSLLTDSDQPNTEAAEEEPQKPAQSS